MAKMTFKSAAKHSVKGWGAVLTGGILLTVLALIGAPRGGGTSATAGSAAATADGSTGCQMQVNVAELTVRSEPAITAQGVGTLRQGTVVDATRQVTDGFRQLTGDRWVANEYLVPVAGTSC
jgi:hypothetical protein